MSNNKIQYEFQSLVFLAVMGLTSPLGREIIDGQEVYLFTKKVHPDFKTFKEYLR